MNKTIKTSPEIIEALTKLGFELTDRSNGTSFVHNLSFWAKKHEDLEGEIYITDQDLNEPSEGRVNMLEAKDLLTMFYSHKGVYLKYIITVEFLMEAIAYKNLLISDFVNGVKEQTRLKLKTQL